MYLSSVKKTIVGETIANNVSPNQCHTGVSSSVMSPSLSNLLQYTTPISVGKSMKSLRQSNSTACDGIDITIKINPEDTDNGSIHTTKCTYMISLSSSKIVNTSDRLNENMSIPRPMKGQQGLSSINIKPVPLKHASACITASLETVNNSIKAHQKDFIKNEIMNEFRSKKNKKFLD